MDMTKMTIETMTHTRIYYGMNDSSDDDRNDDTDGSEDSIIIKNMIT